MADAHMREVNAAWEVLGTPEARTRYDQTLNQPGGSTSAPAAPAGARTGRPPVAPRAPSFGDRLVDPRMARVDERRGWRWVPIVGLLAAAVLVVVITAYASHGHSTPGGSTPGSTVAGGYPVGSCVAVTAGPQALVVPCDQPHTGTVASTTDYPRPCPSGTYTVSLVAESISLCLTSS